MTPPLALEDAQARLLAAVTPLDREMAPVDSALGRWLAAPAVARRTSPEADLSAMDGFATAGQGPWRLVGESAAGHPWPGGLNGGEAIRISTGAHMPSGSDGILLSEDARLNGGDVLASCGIVPSATYVRKAGFDFSAGETVMEGGVRIAPPQLALALAAGLEELKVGKLPRLAVIDTGDELSPNPSSPHSGMVPASNGRMLAAMATGLASSIDVIGPIPDDLAPLRSAFEHAGDVDVIVTSGGASAGGHDLVRPALKDWGAEIDFWRVAIRPGRPLLMARRGSQLIVGLPGNPVSAFVTCLLFVLPLLRRLGGAARDACLPLRIPAVLAAGVPAGGQRREFLRGRLTDEGVVPLLERDSSALRKLASANLLIDRPAGASPAVAGDIVPVFMLGER